MTDPATITGGPSDEAIARARLDYGRTGGHLEEAIVAAYAVDEPRIRAEQTRRILDRLDEVATIVDSDEADALLVAHEVIAREFGAST